MDRSTLRIALLLMGLGVGCTGQSQASEAPRSGNPGVVDSLNRHVLRTYNVPPGHEKEVRRLLESTRYPISVVTEAGAQTQFVPVNPTFTGSSIFVLSAPEGIHDGVASMLEILGKTAPPEPRGVEVTYWLVLGSPAPEVAVGQGLAEVSKVTDRLAALGPMRFELLERLQLRSLDGEHTKVSRRTAKIAQTPSVDGKQIELRLEVEVAAQGRPVTLDSALTLEAGQFGVLGQVGYAPEVADKPAGAPSASVLFYVARAEIVK